MRICLVSGEIFAWNKYGGFGRATRWIGRELVRRGHDVCAVVPRRAGQRPVETLDGITVYGFPMFNPLASIPTYRRCNADIYHSQQPSLGTALAMIGASGRKHVVTCRDIKSAQDWLIELRLPSRSPVAARLSRLYEDNPLVRWSVRRADGVYSAYHGGGKKAQEKFGLSFEPAFLPSPIVMPEQRSKSDTPMVCFVGRWDRRKRPQLFFELAREFPDVQFVAVGCAQDRVWEKALRERYGGQRNLELRTFVNQFESGGLDEVYSRNWILVNASPREGMPTTFLEAAAHGCAILSCVNPDGFTQLAGFHATAETLADGLRYLLEDDRWRACGERGREWVRAKYEASRAMDLHCALYADLLGEGR